MQYNTSNIDVDVYRPISARHSSSHTVPPFVIWRSIDDAAYLSEILVQVFGTNIILTIKRQPPLYHQGTFNVLTLFEVCDSGLLMVYKAVDNICELLWILDFQREVSGLFGLLERGQWLV